MADFSGWAMKHGLLCSDGVIIKQGAFKVKDGTKVPLVYGHVHNDINAILGHAFLYNKPEGIWAEAYFNESPSGKNAKSVMQNGDIDSMSIFAINVEKEGNQVVHGDLKEVSIVIAGANPGAFVESVAHAGYPMDEYETEGIFYTGESIVIGSETKIDPTSSELKHSEQSSESTKSGDKTVEEVLNTLNEEQQIAVSYAVEQLLKSKENENKEAENKDKDENPKKEEGEKKMAHNLFENSDPERILIGTPIITKEKWKMIVEDGERLGSLSKSIKHHMMDKGGVLYHADIPAGTGSVPKTGMILPTGEKPTYGIHGMDMLFPEPTPISQTPEFIKRSTDWVSKWSSRVHHTPYSKISMMYADITENEARARGYIKGSRKSEEVFSLLKRTVSPTTVYKKIGFDRDDFVDVDDGFAYVSWIHNEMNMMMDEELARAQLIGDGRPAMSNDHIDATKIIPVVMEPSLFNTVIKVTVPENATNEQITKATIRSIIKSRKFYKGTGRPPFWTTEDVITDMMLLENKIEEKIFKSEAELATQLRVDELIPVEPMEGAEIEVTESDGTKKKYPLIGVMVNPANYNVGSSKLGKKTFFDGFDIHFNKQYYLLEQRSSGCLIKPFSAVTFVLDKPTTTTPSKPNDDEEDGEDNT